MEKMDKLEVVLHVSALALMVGLTGAFGYVIFVISQAYLKALGV